MACGIADEGHSPGAGVEHEDDVESGGYDLFKVFHINI